MVCCMCHQITCFKSKKWNQKNFKRNKFSHLHDTKAKTAKTKNFILSADSLSQGTDFWIRWDPVRNCSSPENCCSFNTEMVSSANKNFVSFDNWLLFLSMHGGQTTKVSIDKVEFLEYILFYLIFVCSHLFKHVFIPYDTNQITNEWNVHF